MNPHSGEALTLANRAIDRDPTNAVAYLNLGIMYFRARRFSEAEPVLRKAIELAPHTELLGSVLASVLMYRGEPVAALKELELEPAERWREALRPQILDVLGRGREADAALAAFESKFANDAAYSIAAIYARRRDADHAFDWLDRAYRQRESLIPDVGNDPDFSNLAADPRYTVLLRKLNLPKSLVP